MTTVTSDFAKRLDKTAEDTEALLAKLLSDTLLPDEIARPKRLMDAMRYSSLGGGKRLRPFLVVESSAVFGVPREAALLAGAALECIHCYSLIHDDLPAMDNSDLRRGRPTLHKKTDDATAILAGDGLLTLAFDIITRDEIHHDPTVRLLLTRALARASGIGGMVGGQMLDLAGEGRFGDREPVDVARLQQMKTGALLRYGCIAGAILGQSSQKEYQALDDYGRALGEAFQIADDLLDVEGDAAALGKPPAQDAALGKTTFVTQLGIDGAKQRVRDLLARADRRCRSSAPRATCCAPPRASSPNARTEAASDGRTEDELDEVLARFRKMPVPVRVVYARPRTFISIALGIVAFFLLPGSLRLVTRLLVGWDVFVALYLVLVYIMMLRSDIAHIRRNAVLQDDGRFLILLVTALGAFASIAAIVFELGASNRSGPGLALATITIALSWAAVHTAFALHYAHDYYRGSKPGGLQFPSGDSDDHADYWDFVYFSFVIGMTAQVSDVGITDKIIRRTATVHGIISFVYNTALVALMVNIAASAI